MGGAEPHSNDNPLSAGSLFAAVGAVASGVALLAATGLLGQIERDHTTAFSVALGLTVGGTFAAALATSGLLDKEKHAANVVRALGAGAVCAGVIVAAIYAVVTARDHGEPVIDVSVTPVKLPRDPTAATKTYLVDAETKESGLPVNARVTIIVDGLRQATRTNAYTPTTLFHGKYGPTRDGDLDVHARVQVTRGASAPDFTAVGVQALVAFTNQQAEDNPCGNYAKRVSSNTPAQRQTRAELDPGCVVVTLPGAIRGEADVSTPVPTPSHPSSRFEREE